jgi:general stress protein YciG
MSKMTDKKAPQQDPEEHKKISQRGGETTREKYGPEFYRSIGHKGGQASPTKFTSINKSR